MFAKIFKTAIALGASYCVGQVTARAVAQAYPEQTQRLVNNFRANKRVSYFRQLQADGLWDSSFLGIHMNDLFHEHSVTNPRHLFVGAVVPFDGTKDTIIIEGIQGDDDSMIVFYDGKELFAGTHTRFNVIELCKKLSAETGALIMHITNKI